ncbi:MAG: type II toxin-antitoxin system RelE/ParE family toxin [Candidatus Paceibacteria bacterium]
MKWKFKYSKKAEKQCLKFEQGTQDRIDEKIKEMVGYYNNKEVPRPDIKKLKGKYEGLYRLRIGDYRVIYKMNSKRRVIIILLIRKRKDAY